LNKKLDIVQAMRGCAALLVVMLHGYDVLWDVSPTYHTTWGEALFFPGACRVDLFFMISGFIMALYYTLVISKMLE
jgi:peptidoglycan/LPS O-acetylase OafA/YrhL